MSSYNGKSGKPAHQRARGMFGVKLATIERAMRSKRKPDPAAEERAEEKRARRRARNLALRDR